MKHMGLFLLVVLALSGAQAASNEQGKKAGGAKTEADKAVETEAAKKEREAREKQLGGARDSKIDVTAETKGKLAEAFSSKVLSKADKVDSNTRKAYERAFDSMSQKSAETAIDLISRLDSELSGKNSKAVAHATAEFMQIIALDGEATLTAEGLQNFVLEVFTGQTLENGNAVPLENARPIDQGAAMERLQKVVDSMVSSRKAGSKEKLTAQDAIEKEFGLKKDQLKKKCY